MELLPSDVESKSFRVVRKGYDSDEVVAYLKKVGNQMSRLEERAKIALVKADRLERKLIEAQRATDPVATAYDDAFEVRRRLIAEAEEEAAQIRAEAAGPADPFSRHEPTPEPGPEESAEILEGARLEAARIEEEAQRLVAHARSMAARMETEAAEVLAEARARAERILAEAAAEAESLRPAAVDHPPRADGSALIEPPIAVTVPADGSDTTIDLTERPQDPAAKPSRYMSRSAGLPRIGKSAGSVLGDMQKVRKKETD